MTSPDKKRNTIDIASYNCTIIKATACSGFSKMNTHNENEILPRTAIGPSIYRDNVVLEEDERKEI